MLDFPELLAPKNNVIGAMRMLPVSFQALKFLIRRCFSIHSSPVRVQQDQVRFTRVHQICEQTRQLQGPLPFGKIEHSPRQFEIDIEHRGTPTLVDIPQRGGLTGSGWGHHHDQTMVQ